MRIIALSTLKAFWEENPEYQDAKAPALAWHRLALHADWCSPAEVKQDFRSASILKDGRVVFNIAGNKYRLVVWINYAYRVGYIRFIETHAQYEKFVRNEFSRAKRARRVRLMDEPNTRLMCRLFSCPGDRTRGINNGHQAD